MEVAIGTWLLERQLGAVCVVPLIVSLGKRAPLCDCDSAAYTRITVCALGQSQVAKTIGQHQKNWNAAIQERVKNTSSILGSMKAVKISGLTQTVEATIQREREHELQTSRPFFTGIMWLNGLGT